MEVEVVESEIVDTPKMSLNDITDKLNESHEKRSVINKNMLEDSAQLKDLESSLRDSIKELSLKIDDETKRMESRRDTLVSRMTGQVKNVLIGLGAGGMLKKAEDGVNEEVVLNKSVRDVIGGIFDGIQTQITNVDTVLKKLDDMRVQNSEVIDEAQGFIEIIDDMLVDVRENTYEDLNLNKVKMQLKALIEGCIKDEQNMGLIFQIGSGLVLEATNTIPQTKNELFKRITMNDFMSALQSLAENINEVAELNRATGRQVMEAVKTTATEIMSISDKTRQDALAYQEENVKTIQFFKEFEQKTIEGNNKNKELMKVLDSNVEEITAATSILTNDIKPNKKGK